MSLMDLLSGLFQPQQTQNYTSSSQGSSASPQASAPTVDGVDVHPMPRPNVNPQPMYIPPVNSSAPQSPQGASLDYNNISDIAALHQAMAQQPSFDPRLAGGNQGLYAVLPKGLQHGTLRNMLGAIGDAFSVSGGKEPSYADAAYRQAIGNAQAGMYKQVPDPMRPGQTMNDPNAMDAAQQRVGMLNPNLAQKMQGANNEYLLRNATLDQNWMWHQQLTQEKNLNMYRQMAPQAQADLASAKSPQEYQEKLATWEARIKAYDPNADVSALGITGTYGDGSLSGTTGMTNNQITQHSDRQTSQATSRRDTDVRARATMNAAQANSAARMGAASISANRPSEANFENQLTEKMKHGYQPSPQEVARFQHDTQLGRGRPQLATNPNTGGAAAHTGFSAYARGANGQRVGWNGSHWVPVK